MTDPTHTTNEQIALKLGWKTAKLEEAQVWFLPSKAGPQGDPPDFLRDWAHNGPLQDELWAAGFDLSHDVKDGTFYWWRMGEDGPEPLDDDREDTTDLKKATALDWLAWKKEEKDEGS